MLQSSAFSGAKHLHVFYISFIVYNKLYYYKTFNTIFSSNVRIADTFAEVFGKPGFTTGKRRHYFYKTHWLVTVITFFGSNEYVAGGCFRKQRRIYTVFDTRSSGYTY